MSNDDAYAIVKTLVEKKADIVAVHKEALSFSLDNQVQDRSPIPFHPGALKYFKEKGIGAGVQGVRASHLDTIGDGGHGARRFAHLRFDPSPRRS